jgi:hypothetical protein
MQAPMAIIPFVRDCKKRLARVQIEQILVLAEIEPIRFSDFRRLTCTTSESERNTGS